jgi:glycosyltransferase involved in cell wall biosynthesis
MKAGIDYIKGDALVIIDADLQDQPELIPQMVAEIENGYDDVYAQRISRAGETWLKKTTSNLYYLLLKRMSNIPIQENTGDYRMFSKKAILALKELKESELNMKGLFSYVGFKKKAIFYERDHRIAGETKWSYLKLIILAIKGLTSFSVAPLRVVSIAGVIVSVAAFIFMLFILIKTIFYGEVVTGYPSLIAVVLFLGGVQLLAVGIIGEYIGIIYSETKKRPLYFVNEYKEHELRHNNVVK